jgi:hypothetical protein
MRRNVPYGIIFPIIVVCAAIALMLWAMRGTNSGTGGSGETAQNTYTRPNVDPVRVPTTPNNDTAGDSARTPNTPLNKSR